MQLITRTISVSVKSATATSLAWYYGVNKPRKDAYANFYATYDADRDFERMKVIEKLWNCLNDNDIFPAQAAGVFQSQAIIEEKLAELGGGAEEEAAEEEEEE